jgi:hypothetical protein
MPAAYLHTVLANCEYTPYDVRQSLKMKKKKEDDDEYERLIKNSTNNQQIENLPNGHHVLGCTILTFAF